MCLWIVSLVKTQCWVCHGVKIRSACYNVRSRYNSIIHLHRRLEAAGAVWAAKAQGNGPCSVCARRSLLLRRFARAGGNTTPTGAVLGLRIERGGDTDRSVIPISRWETRFNIISYNPACRTRSPAGHVRPIEGSSSGYCQEAGRVVRATKRGGH